MLLLGGWFVGNVASFILDQLDLAGVERIYGVAGDAVFPLIDGLARRNRPPRFVPMAREDGAAFAAVYEARLTGRPAACLATSGPGATGLLSGVAEAHLDGAPLVVLTGQVKAARVGTPARQYLDQQQLFRAVTARSELLLAPEAVAEALPSALAQALGGAAVHLAVPEDLFQQPLNRQARRVQAVPAAAPATLGEWDQALADLLAARRPLIVVGSLWAGPGLSRALDALAENWGAAVVLSLPAKGALPFHHPRVIGGIGGAHVPSLVGEADFLCLVGDVQEELPYLPRVSGVAVGSRPMRTGRGLPQRVGDPVLLLQELAQVRPQVDPRWGGAITAARVELSGQAWRVAAEKGPAVNPYRLVLELSSLLPEDGVVVLDVGAFMHWFVLGFQGSQRVLASTRWGALGAGVPGALGARLASQGRKVVALVGDGGLLTSLAELPTVAREGLDLLILVVENGVYDLEEQKMVAQGLQPAGLALHLPDLVALARSCGLEAERVSSPADLEGALRRALDARGPYLLDVICSRPALPLIGLAP